MFLILTLFMQIERGDLEVVVFGFRHHGNRIQPGEGMLVIESSTLLFRAIKNSQRVYSIVRRCCEG